MTVRVNGNLVEIVGASKQIIVSATLSSGSGGTGGSSVFYFHNQPVASSTWTINHNLGFAPQTQVFNSGGVEVFGEIVNTNNNQTVVNFIIPIAGYARLN